ncbi:AraC family transcriptional regulator [Capnocytophaga felis]|uniref:AraC family transcriptional regulator n=1 Tax=Capnocytophaga felis TaxID=2267611 RepID=A0A5M4BC05_9FLAO|nr:AraC family transcriptional regulator [Capnocytophaga felis]GET46990.1 AraC family transcriptional regulator [Capnocytophaga felis]GET49510.1 AraC family transcriptional regulator [Capnocytophaga felis]
MSRFPNHRSSQLSDFGVYLKTVVFQTSASSEKYAFSHTDDYYFFGFIEDGQCCLNIDFEEYTFGKESLAIIHPGQVHRIIDAFNLFATFLIIDSVLVNEEEKQTLERYGCPRIQLSDISELKLLLSLLDRKLSCMENPSAKAIVQRLTTVIVGLVVENVANAIKVQSELQGTVSRHKEIVWEFRDLLESNIQSNRSPSFYTGRLNITVAYLNEAVNAVLGTSVSRHIQDEIVLQAKRQLVYTKASVKEITHSLGFDDYSYFTRLFTKVVGVSPTLFRKNYHE